MLSSRPIRVPSSSRSNIFNGGETTSTPLLSNRRPMKHIDRKRAPKIAAALCIALFVVTGFSYTIEHMNEIKLYASSKGTSLADPSNVTMDDQKITTSSDDALNASDTHALTIDMLIEEMSTPNLGVNGEPIPLPSEYTYLADINTSPGKHEIPFFWHIPRSGGSTIKDIAAFCLDLTVASEAGPSIDPAASAQNQLMTVVHATSGAKFVNVDTTSPEGLERAKSLNVASYPGLNLISSPYFFQASGMLFDAPNHARVFVLLRHPVERAVSMYYYMRDHTGIRGAQIGDTIDLYAKSNMVENNWMTRFLSNKMGGELTADDEALSREVLRTKCLIGLLSKKTESMRRFKEYNGWKTQDITQKQDCEEKLLNWGWIGKNKHKMIKKNDETWNMLQDQNSFDLRLYEYAVKLFEVQGALLFQDSI